MINETMAMTSGFFHEVLKHIGSWAPVGKSVPSLSNSFPQGYTTNNKHEKLGIWRRRSGDFLLQPPAAKLFIYTYSGIAFIYVAKHKVQQIVQMDLCLTCTSYRRTKYTYLGPFTELEQTRSYFH